MSNDKHTVRIHRVLSAPPARVYKAFIDPLAKNARGPEPTPPLPFRAVDGSL